MQLRGCLWVGDIDGEVYVVDYGGNIAIYFFLCELIVYWLSA